MVRRIGFIGAGTIGSAMIRTIIGSGFSSASVIYASDVENEKLLQLKRETGINICPDNAALAAGSDVIVIAVKPQLVKKVVEDIKPELEGKMIITIAAGIPIKIYEDILGHSRRIFRAMPNLPLLVGEGMTLIACRDGSDSDDVEFCKAFFKNFGRVEEMDESLLSTVISLTASSPAYVFLLIESIATSVVRSGIPVNTAYRIIAQTILGSAKMLLESGEEHGRLVDELNEELESETGGVEPYNKDKIRKALMEAVDACNKKALLFEKISE